MARGDRNKVRLPSFVAVFTDTMNEPARPNMKQITIVRRAGGSAWVKVKGHWTTTTGQWLRRQQGEGAPRPTNSHTDDAMRGGIRSRLKADQ